MKNFFNLKLTALILLAVSVVIMPHFAFSQGTPWITTGNNTTGGEVFGSTSAQNLNIITSNTQRMTILGTNGNIGIGSASPLQLLDIAGNTTISSNSWYGINNARILSNPGTNNIYVGINAYSTSSTGSRNTHLGYNAGNGVSGAADNNTFVGNSATSRLT